MRLGSVVYLDLLNAVRRPQVSECYPGCTGPTGGFCPADHCWSVFIPSAPACVPNAGTSCSAGSNSCGMPGTGTVQCNGSCSGSVPSDSLCPPPPPPTPTCADLGMLGTYPSCYSATPPTCADYGQLGTYPSCYSAPTPTCADTGQLGTYPSCYSAPTPTCADLGKVGTYPACTTAPATTCADLGKVGIYPFCSDPTPPPTTCSSPAVTITAAPTRISSGGSSTLTVTGTGINTSCTVTGPGVNTTITASACNASNSSIPTGALTSQATYTVTCDTGAAVNKVIVNVNPTFKPF